MAKSPPSAHLGENIRNARTAANLTQLALAHKLGYSGPDAGAYISRIESGQEPRIDTLGKLAKALDTTIEALLSAPDQKLKSKKFDSRASMKSILRHQKKK